MVGTVKLAVYASRKSLSSVAAAVLKNKQRTQPPILCLGNPLLDIQAVVTAEYLHKYALNANDAVVVDPAGNDDRMDIFDELMASGNAKLIAGGSAQNTARGIAYLLGKGHVGYFGCVGEDIYAAKLLSTNENAGVLSLYQVENNESTGRCAALITGSDRSLVTVLGAAKHFSVDHLDDYWSHVQHAQLLYATGFHLTASPDAVIKLAKHAFENNKPFIFNLSAPFVPAQYKLPLKQVLQYASVVVGNASEASSLAHSFGFGCDTRDLKAIGENIVGNTNKLVVFTDELSPTVAVSSQGTRLYKVKVVDSVKIVDTNGAGDAFTAGLISGIYLKKPLDSAIDMGQQLAALTLYESGPSYPLRKS